MGTQFKAAFFLLFFYAVLAKQNQLSSSLEHQDLLNLRSSLGIRARDWPRKSDPCSNWTGIGC
ncbi:hypothetical protein GQL56_29380, partial [Pseudomonas putida]|nr:hypothetical protein [Pseudomonas putida]